MKKILTLVLIAVMLCTGFAFAGESQFSAEGLGGYKIGFYYTPPTDILSKGFHDVLDYCAEITNCEMEYYDMTEWSAQAVTTAVETLVSNGCDAVIIIFGTSPAMFEYLNENGVYYVCMTRSHTDEVAAVADNSPYCCGYIGSNATGTDNENYKNGYQLAETLYEQGCRNIAIVGGSEGEQLNDERVAGAEGAAAELGMNIVTSYRGKDFATGYADILSSFGNDLDGIVCTGGSDAGVAAIMSSGYAGKIKLAQIDAAGEDTRDYMEAGLLNGVMAGGSTYMANFYMQLFNALSGAERLWETDKIVPNYGGFLVTTAEEWDLANSLMSGECPGGLIPDNLLSLNSICNPLSVEELEALWTSYLQADYWNVNSIAERVDAYLN